MFLRMIRGTLLRQWKKMLMIAFTIALGASLAAAMLSVMLDVGDKVNQELKTYGANITVAYDEPLRRILTITKLAKRKPRSQKIRSQKQKIKRLVPAQLEGLAFCALVNGIVK